MKSFLAFTILVIGSSAYAAGNVVYGRDNRQDIYQVTNALHKKLAASTAAMIPTGIFQKATRQGFFDLQSRSLERTMNVCPSESFAQQPNPAICSGFLVGPDTLVTAGHCFVARSTAEEACKNFAWVFDFNMKSASSNPLRDIPISNIYLCKQVIQAQLSASSDFSVIKLDRPVIGRDPLKYRTSGRVSMASELVVIGHPTGLPTKVSPGGKVTKNDDPTRFSTTLDTFQGNSGSAVFDASSGLVEGILIQGKNDYIPSKQSDPRSCLVVNKCDDNGSSCAGGDDPGAVQWGEVVLRLNQVLPHIQRALGLTK
jgi:V8-like Glu-specific endopeptidase